MIKTKFIDFHWKSSVFIYANHIELIEAISSWADSMKCHVELGDHDTDLTFIPFFIAVIDRNLVTDEGWEVYLDYFKHVHDPTPTGIPDLDAPKDDFSVEDSPLIILDKETRFYDPPNLRLYYINPEDINEIIEIINGEYFRIRNLLH